MWLVVSVDQNDALFRYKAIFQSEFGTTENVEITIL